MKKYFVLLSTAVTLLAGATESMAQNVTYETFTAPIFRKALNQRFSNYQHIQYRVHVSDNVIFPMVEKKWIEDDAGKDKIRKIFDDCMVDELKKASLNPKSDAEPDLIVDCYLFSLTAKDAVIPGAEVFSKGYEVTAEYRTKVTNRAGKVYSEKTTMIHDKRSVPDSEKYDSKFYDYTTGGLFSRGPVYSGYYRVLMNVVKSQIDSHQSELVSRFRDKKFELPLIYRASKKFPDLTLIDSMNQSLVKELRTKSTTDYSTIIPPYVANYQALLERTFPENYDKKQIKLAAYSSLVFLYYLSYDKDKMQTALDSLYNYSNKVFGVRGDYDGAKEFKMELEPYYATLNLPKYDVMEKSERIKVATASADTSQWIRLATGDTIRGQFLLGAQRIIALSTILTFESDGHVKKYRLPQVKSFRKEGKTYEVYKNGPNDKEFAFEVLYSSDKIKVVKDNFDDHPTFTVFFIRPGETALQNADKGLGADRTNILKNYLKDSPAVNKKLDDKAYDLDKEASLIEMAKDYTNKSA